MKVTRWSLTVGAALVGFLAFAMVLSAQDSDGGAAQPFPSTEKLSGISASSSGLQVVANGAGFSGLATIVSLHLIPEPDSGLEQIAAASVPDDAFTSESLAPTAGALALPLPVGESRDHITWRLAPVHETGPATISFDAVDVTMPSGETRRITGAWRLEVPTPSDIALRMNVETLVARKGPASSAGVKVRVEGARRSATETLVTVVVDSPNRVTQLGQPHLRVDGERLEGTVVRTSDDGKVLQLAFPSTPAEEPVTLVMGPFAHVPADGAGTTTINLGQSMARQGLKGELGESGVVDRLIDVVATDLAAPDVLSYEFRSSARVGEKATVIAFTVVGNYTDLDAMFALTDSGPLPVDLMVSSHRRDGNGVLTEGTTRVSFRLPPEVPDTVVLGTDGRMEIIRGDWSIELTP